MSKKDAKWYLGRTAKCRMPGGRMFIGVVVRVRKTKANGCTIAIRPPGCVVGVWFELIDLVSVVL